MDETEVIVPAETVLELAMRAGQRRQKRVKWGSENRRTAQFSRFAFSLASLTMSSDASACWPAAWSWAICSCRRGRGSSWMARRLNSSYRYNLCVSSNSIIVLEKQKSRLQRRLGTFLSAPRLLP